MSSGNYFALIGTGKQGEQIAADLLKSPGTGLLLLLDYNHRSAIDLGRRLNDPRIVTGEIDGMDINAVARAIKGYDVLILAADYEINENATKAAIDAGVNVTDLGGSNIIVDKQFALNGKAKHAGIVVIPDQGYMPGLTGIVAEFGFRRRGMPEYEHEFAAGLPQNPEGPLGYLSRFASKGLVNEYINKSRTLRDYRITELPGLSERKDMVFKHPDLKEPLILEKALTSGGLSTRPDSYSGIVKTMDGSTGRYPGHYEKIASIDDAGLFSEESIETETRSRREIVGNIIENMDLSENDLMNLDEMGFFEDVELPQGISTPRQLAEDVISECTTYDGLDMGLLEVVIGSRDWEANYSMMHKQEEGGPTSMAVLTGWSQSITAQMIANKMLKQRGDGKANNGVLRTEFAILPELYISELDKRGIKLYEDFLVKVG